MPTKIGTYDVMQESVERLHGKCRVVHVNDVVNATLSSEIFAERYPQGDLHRIYYGEIQAVYRH